MKIVFLVGNNRELALYRVAGRGVKVSAVIGAEAQDGILGSWRRACEQLGISCLLVGRKGVSDVIDGLSPDVLVSIGFPYILPADVLNHVGRLALNVHPTLLPKYRGPRSGYYILANNDTQSGVTIHRMTGQVDRGDIARQASFSLSVFDTPVSMMRKSRALEADLLADVLDDVVRGRELTWAPQDESQASEYLAMRTPDDSIMDPAKPLIELYHHIRACNAEKYPAFFEVEGQRVYVKLWRACKSEGEDDML
jgi:methionyl-tRNA formyltransferase